MAVTPSRDITRFNFLQSETGAVYHGIAQSLGISDSVMTVLYTLCETGGACTLREIVRRSGIPKQTLHSALRSLMADGYLTLEAETAKRKTVRLTDAGQEFAARTAGRVIRAENEIFASWSQSEIDAYLALSEKYLRTLEQKAKELQNDSTLRSL